MQLSLVKEVVSNTVGSPLFRRKSYQLSGAANVAEANIHGCACRGNTGIDIDLVHLLTCLPSQSVCAPVREACLQNLLTVGIEAAPWGQGCCLC
jgi:hypothetical protein